MLAIINDYLDIGCYHFLSNMHTTMSSRGWIVSPCYPHSNLLLCLLWHRALSGCSFKKDLSFHYYVLKEMALLLLSLDFCTSFLFLCSVFFLGHCCSVSLLITQVCSTLQNLIGSYFAQCVFRMLYVTRFYTLRNIKKATLSFFHIRPNFINLRGILTPKKG